MVSEAIEVNFHINEYTDYLSAVWCKFHVHSLFYSDVIEKRRTPLFSMCKVHTFAQSWCHVFYGKSGKTEFHYF